MTTIDRLLAATAIAFVLVSSSIPADAKEPATAEAPLLPVLHSLDLGEELAWYYRSDVGFLLAFGGGRLYRIDLLAPDARAPDPIPFPDLSGRGSVVPVAGTGIILVPSAPAGLVRREAGQRVGGEAATYALDTLSGRFLSEASPLAPVDFLFSLQETGLAVIRSFADTGSVIAGDLLTGACRWAHDVRAVMIWIDRPYVRAIAEAELLTFDIASGAIVRRDPIRYEDRGYALRQEGVFLDWSGREITAYTLPPPPRSEPAPMTRLWEFKAGGSMIKACVMNGACSVDRVGDNRLRVRSATHHEILDIRTGRVLLDVKKGGHPTVGRYEADRVHGIVLFPAFDVGLSLENDNRVLRILDLKGKGAVPAE